MVVTVSSLGALGGGRGDRRAGSLRSEGVRSGSDLAAAAKEKGVLLRHGAPTIPPARVPRGRVRASAVLRAPPSTPCARDHPVGWGGISSSG